MSSSITIKNILMTDFLIDYDRITKVYTARISMNDILIGRMMSMLPPQNKPIHFQVNLVGTDRNRFMNPGMSRAIPRILCVIDGTHGVYIDKDFRPQPFMDESPEAIKSMYMDKGVQPASRFVRMETACSGLFDITFNDIYLEPFNIGKIDVLLFKFNNVTATIKSTIMLNDIGIATGCPNWG
jgi:hypothetical protein